MIVFTGLFNTFIRFNKSSMIPTNLKKQSYANIQTLFIYTSYFSVWKSDIDGKLNCSFHKMDDIIRDLYLSHKHPK